MGKVNELTLSYLGTETDAFIEVYEGKDRRADKFLFSGTFNQFDTFTFVGIKANGEMGNEISVWVDGVRNTKIHTSCSKPIGPGLISDDFEVVSGTSSGNGELCPVPPPPPPGSNWCDGAKAKALEVQYTGEDCSATNHNQDPSKVECSGDPAFAPLVRILATDKANPNDNRAKVWFDDEVVLGSTFWIDATNGGDTKLKAETHVFIFDGQGNLLQTIEFHTSCSQPLGAGDQFGSLLMIDFVPE
jgi:hypothetical protein